jgi:hypothetical protein
MIEKPGNRLLLEDFAAVASSRARLFDLDCFGDEADEIDDRAGVCAEEDELDNDNGDWAINSSDV